MSLFYVYLSAYHASPLECEFPEGKIFVWWALLLPVPGTR